jgi:hypothetical protein
MRQADPQVTQLDTVVSHARQSHAPAPVMGRDVTPARLLGATYKAISDSTQAGHGPRAESVRFCRVGNGSRVVPLLLRDHTVLMACVLVYVLCSASSDQADEGGGS